MIPNYIMSKTLFFIISTKIRNETMNIFEAIREDHEVQRDLLDQLVQTSGDSPERRDIFQEIKRELDIHAIAEERHFYVPLIEADKTQDQARHGVHEHHLIDELLKKLTEMEYDNTAWLTTAKQLQDKVEHHLEDEEHTIFQMAGKVLNEKEKENYAKTYRESMEAERKKY